MYSAETRKRRVQADNAGVLSFLKPGLQLIATAYAKPAEIDDLEFCAAPLAQARDTLQRLQVIVERRSDEDPDFKIGTLGLSLVVEPVHELLETGKWQGTSLA